MLTASTIIPLESGNFHFSVAFKGDTLPLEHEYGIHLRFPEICMGAMESAPILLERRADTLPMFDNLGPNSVIAQFNERRELVSVIIFTSRGRTVRDWLNANPRWLEVLRPFILRYKCAAPDLFMLANVAVANMAD